MDGFIGPQLQLKLKIILFYFIFDNFSSRFEIKKGMRKKKGQRERESGVGEEGMKRGEGEERRRKWGFVGKVLG